MAPAAADFRSVGAVLLLLTVMSMTSAQNQASSAGVSSSESAGIHCEIRETANDGRIEIRGIAISSTPVSGEYQFDVNRSSMGDQSITRQLGFFELEPNVETVLGMVALGGDAAKDYEVSLVLTVNGQSFECLRRA